MSIKEKVMLVNLSISQWSARKFDAAATKEVDDNHNAKDAGRYNKLLINDDSLKAITKVAGKARTFHYYNTLPWSDNGDRILPVTNYFQYIGEMGKIKDEFNTVVSEFLNSYSNLVQDAYLRLGTLFNATDYPKPSEIIDKYSISWSFMPVSDADDMRVALSDSEVDVIKKAITDEVQFRVATAVDDIYSRIKEAVSHMAVTLADPDKIFRDSVVTNICNLIEILPRLNFNSDPKLTDLVKAIKPLCCDPDRLRSEPLFRKQMAQLAHNAVSTFV